MFQAVVSGVQWCHSGVAVVSQWRYSGVTVVTFCRESLWVAFLFPGSYRFLRLYVLVLRTHTHTITHMHTHIHTHTRAHTCKHWHTLTSGHVNIFTYKEIHKHTRKSTKFTWTDAYTWRTAAHAHVHTQSMPYTKVWCVWCVSNSCRCVVGLCGDVMQLCALKNDDKSGMRKHS
jgi:hypothetical protein